ncbi:N-acetyltransferase [Bacteroidales bacterium AH-315-I05]|nr:N-acetyltransferase [Bacteroidales bacterium AH-315-I05]
MLNVDNDRQCLVNIKVGKDVKIFNFVNAYGCEIGDNSKIGSFVEIQKNAIIGKNCKISSHSFICEGVHIKDNVFIGHGVTFINDKYPKAVNTDGSMQTDSDWKVIATIVERGVSIGSGSTILCGIKIGENATVGAGSVVTRDVQPNAVIAGNPAKSLKK